MKAIEVRKQGDVISIQNDKYPQKVNCIGMGITVDIGVEYIYLQWYDSPWLEKYYVDLNNHVQSFTEAQLLLVESACTSWVQPLGQEGNPTVAQAKLSKKHKYVSEFELTISSMVGVDVTTSEMASWTKQEAEARAWTADNNAVTPLIDNLLIGRNITGETKASLVDTIIAKADGYAQGYALVLGMYHAKQKQLEACTTVEQILALL